MTASFFASDLHGSAERFAKLFAAIAAERPAAVFLGGDLLPGLLAGFDPSRPGQDDFVRDVIAAGLGKLRLQLGGDYPAVFAIFGNDDPRVHEAGLLELEAEGLLSYAHGRSFAFRSFRVYGYACVPPTPFGLKDWERYDVSRYVDPGCVSPEAGGLSVPVPDDERRNGTIVRDLELLTGDDPMDRAVLLFHTPPYRTKLDRAALDGRSVDHVPLDVNVGSIAVRRFLERRQPWVTLHGHVHESARLTGDWRDRIGRTEMFGAAHDGPELALVRFDLEAPAAAERILL